MLSVFWCNIIPRSPAEVLLEVKEICHSTIFCYGSVFEVKRFGYSSVHRSVMVRFSNLNIFLPVQWKLKSTQQLFSQNLPAAHTVRTKWPDPTQIKKPFLVKLLFSTSPLQLHCLAADIVSNNSLNKKSLRRYLYRVSSWSSHWFFGIGELSRFRFHWSFDLV